MRGFSFWTRQSTQFEQMRRTTENYEVRQVRTTNEGKGIFLVAYHHHNVLTGQTGYILYQTEAIDKWSVWDSKPLVDTILFRSAGEALDFGEKIFEQKASARFDLGRPLDMGL